MLRMIGLSLFFNVLVSGALFADGLLYPVDVAINAKGEIVVADHEAHALLRLDKGGFTAIATGEGLPRTPLYGIRHVTPEGDGHWIASDPATMKLYRIGASGSIEAVADDDRFVTPWGVLVDDSGDLLAVDRVTQRLRRVKAGGEVIDVVEVRAPRAILKDKEGALLVLTDNNILKIIDGGATPLLSSPPFEFPHDAVLHPNGNLYVSDGYARAIWQVTPDGSVSAFVQGEPLVSPQGMAVDGEGNLLVADAHAQTVFQITPQGKISELGK